MPSSRRGSTRSVAVTGVILVFGFTLSCSEGPSGLTAGPAAAMVIVGGNNQTGVVGVELPNPLVVLVTDAKGKAVQGQIVNFVVTQGGGTVFAGGAITNKDGEAREHWTLGTVAGEAQVLEARAVDAATGAKLTFGSFSATATHGPATTLSFDTHPDSTIAGLVLTPAVQVSLKDSYGNAAITATDSVFIGITPGTGEPGAALSGTSRRQAVAGVASFNDLAIGTAGIGYSLTASGVGLTSAESNTFSIFPAVARVDVTPISFGIMLGDTVTLRARAYDAANNEIFGRPVTWLQPSPAFSINAAGLLTGLARGGGSLDATIDGVTGPDGGGGVSIYTAALMDSVSFEAAGWSSTTLNLGVTQCTWLATFDPNNETAALRWVPGTSNPAKIQITAMSGELPQYYCFRATQSGVVNVTGTFGGKTVTKQLTIP